MFPGDIVIPLPDTWTPLSVDEMRHTLRKVRYKPAWNFEVREGRFEGPHLVIRAIVPNAHGLGYVNLDIHSAIPPCFSEKQFLEFLLWRLLRIESHETREFFQYEGELLYDPHADGADRDL